jgi:hypothetical protein
MALDFSILAPIYLQSKHIVSVETHNVETQIKLDKEILMVEFLALFLRNQFRP